MVTGVLIAVHGGAGQARPAARDAARIAALARSLEAGYDLLVAGGTALDAVVAAVEVLESDGGFNAGRGSVRTAESTVEMDAGVADGDGRRVGAVAAIRGVRHPVAAARAVLDDGRHVLLAGEGAAGFARAAGLDFEPDEWFVDTDVHGGAPDPGPSPGTVGAVALDAHGHLAAATSTGGCHGQLPGRVGDSPVPGAGLWADDGTCAVSATGEGEAFLRVAFAHEVDVRLRLSGPSLDDACGQALDLVHSAGGTGGCIALDRHGHLAMPFTTPAMARGYVDPSGAIRIGLGPGPLAAVRRPRG
jgi:isoaspartyl peptidase/L-asparaginase-like protein (Ntn-hydrolase superfamily)